jgi:hypothetical protein
MATRGRLTKPSLIVDANSKNKWHVVTALNQRTSPQQLHPYPPHRMNLSDSFSVYYRPSGSLNNPVLLPQQGFQAARINNRQLLPQFPGHRVLASDLPGFSFTTVPAVIQL